MPTGSILETGNSGFFNNSPFFPRLKRQPEDHEGLNRLNHRYDRIIGSNIEHVRGKRILDLACHNGRWSWAALQSGASFVLGIEGREEAINAGLPHFKEFDSKSYEFVCGDISNILEQDIQSRYGKFDTIFCLGIYYHVIEHYRIFKRMAELKPAFIIIDSDVLESTIPLTFWRPEKVHGQFTAIADREGETSTLIGVVSLGTLELLAATFGFDISLASWDKTAISHTLGLDDYLQSEPVKGTQLDSDSPPVTHRRMTALLRRR